MLGLLWILLELVCVRVLAADPAAGGQAPVVTSDKRYVYQYFLVALCIALGIILICQPRNREESIESRTDLAFQER